MRAKTKNAITFSDLVKFVKEEAELATDQIFSPNNLKWERNKESNREGSLMPFKGRTRRPPSANTLVTSTGGDANQKLPRPPARCLICRGSHSLEECMEYMKRSVQERVAFLKSKGVCFGCLEKGHLSKSCGARLKCKKCARSHPTSLHEDSKNKQETPKEQKSSVNLELLMQSATAPALAWASLLLTPWSWLCGFITKIDQRPKC